VNPDTKHPDVQRVDVRRWRANRPAEIDSATLYDTLAEVERDASIDPIQSLR
jgi:hypothetical protein